LSGEGSGGFQISVDGFRVEGEWSTGTEGMEMAEYDA